jgi:gas vesicle protein
MKGDDRGLKINAPLKGRIHMTCITTKESQTKDRLLALLAGLGAGVLVGLAIAPKSGKKLRDDIGNTVKDYLDSANAIAGELRDSAADFAQRGLREVRKTTDYAARKMNDMVSGAADAANSAVNTGAAKGHEVIDYAADMVKTGTRG